MITKGGLPEHTAYRDDGCDLQPACLSCGLPRCRLELLPGQARSWLRAVALAALLRSGQTIDEAAYTMGLSRRQVLRLKRMDTRGGAG